MVDNKIEEEYNMYEGIAKTAISRGNECIVVKYLKTGETLVFEKDKFKSKFENIIDETQMLTQYITKGNPKATRPSSVQDTGKWGNTVGVIIGFKLHNTELGIDQIYIGYSLKNKKEWKGPFSSNNDRKNAKTFNKDIARVLAYKKGLEISNLLEDIILPHSVLKDLHRFVERCKRYYQNAELTPFWKMFEKKSENSIKEEPIFRVTETCCKSGKSEGCKCGGDHIRKDSMHEKDDSFYKKYMSYMKGKTGESFKEDSEKQPIDRVNQSIETLHLIEKLNTWDKYTTYTHNDMTLRMNELIGAVNFLIEWSGKNARSYDDAPYKVKIVMDDISIIKKALLNYLDSLTNDEVLYNETKRLLEDIDNIEWKRMITLTQGYRKDPKPTEL